jgi:phosphoribosylformimino-5-aminoimidazole carboxamide ribotide isomerase
LSTVRILPVLDLLNGVVVRGVAGRRSEYRPIVSRLTDSTDPHAIADAFRRHLGLTELYLADLDAIAAQPPALALYRALREDGFRLWIDAGVRDRHGAELVAATGAGIVVGLETVAGPDALREILVSTGDVVFSLDLRNGVPLGDRTAWHNADATAIAESVIRLGVRRLLILDLVRVGVGSGTGTEELCAALRRAHPAVEVWCGGGVRHATDLLRLSDLGIAAVLVASALHDGRLTREDCT